MRPMSKVLIACFVMSAVAGSALSQDAKPERLQSWPRWRGPADTGAASGARPPLTWSEKKNVRWKIPLPGKGHSTPVIWEDRIYVTAAVPHGDAEEPARHRAPGAHDNSPKVRRQRSMVFAISRKDGSILWQREVHDGRPLEGGHVTGSFASASPVTDGDYVIASFGARGLHALNRDGKVLWSVDLGAMKTKHAHGEGSSPVLHGDTVVVNRDHEGQSFIAAFDKKTGRERWRKPRTEVTSWATPIVVEHGGKKHLIVSGTRRLRSYDLDTGDILWECGGLAHNVVASPVAGHGMVFAASSYERQAMIAIRLEGAKGDLTVSDNVAWTRRRLTPYVPSPLLYRGVLYLLHHYQAVLCRVDAKTGQESIRAQRLRDLGNIYASPVAAAGRVYVTDLQGMTVVLDHEKPGVILARNRLDDRFSASAGLVDGEIYLRGLRFLYCIAEPRVR